MRVLFLENIRTLINDVEHQLLKLEDVVEEQEVQEQMLNERFQLAVYRSKKLKELEIVSGTYTIITDISIARQFNNLTWQFSYTQFT